MNIDIPFLRSHWDIKEVVRIRNFFVRDEDGVLVEKQKRFVKHEYIHLASGERYWNDPSYVVSVKCFLLSFFNPIATTGRIFFNLCRIPFDITYTTYVTLKEIKGDLLSLKIRAVFNKIFQSAKTLLKDLAEDVSNIVKAPFFGLAFEFFVVIGIVLPLDARRFAGKIERKWNHDIKPTYQNTFNSYVDLLDVFKERIEPFVFYEAVCFQSLGKLSDRSILEINGIRT